MTITYHNDVIQYSPEWDALKCGVLTSSKICEIITLEKMQIADNETSTKLVNQIACERVLKYKEPTFQSYDMARGLKEEVLARKKYSDNYAPVTECGFVTNDKWGFTLGCSPDGLIGEDEGWECKSSLNKLQFAIIRSASMPKKFKFQVQCSLLITDRKVWNFTNYSGGMNMITIRVFPDPVIFAAIENAAFDFENRVKIAVEEYGNRLADGNLRILPTERTPDDSKIIIETEE